MNDISVGVPFSGCEKYYRETNVIATREDEALSIAAGAFLSGKSPLVYMQNSGLGNSVDIITSLLVPYKIKFPVFIKHRDSPEHHALMGEITNDLERLLGYGQFRNC